MCAMHFLTATGSSSSLPTRRQSHQSAVQLSLPHRVRALDECRKCITRSIDTRHCSHLMRRPRSGYLSLQQRASSSSFLQTSCPSILSSVTS